MNGLGYDVKVIPLRNRDGINVTIAVAVVGKEIDDLSHHVNLKEELKERLWSAYQSHSESSMSI